MKGLNTIIKNAGILFIGGISIKLINYLFNVIGSRGLGTEGYGAFALALAVFSIFTTLALVGIPFGITRFISYYMSKNKTDDVASIIKSGFLGILTLSILLCIFMWTKAHWIATLINHPELTSLLKIFALGLPFFAIVTCLEKSLEGFKQMKYSVVVTNSLHATKVLALIIFLSLGFKEEGAVIGFVIGLIISSILGFYFLVKKVFPSIKEGVIKYSAWKQLLTYSWPLIIVNIINPIMKWTDSIILGYFFSTAKVGIYTIGLSTATLLLIVFTSFNMIIFPVMSGLEAQKKRKVMKSQFQIVTTWILMVTLPIAIMCLIYPKQILTLFYGFEFSQGNTFFTKK